MIETTESVEAGGTIVRVTCLGPDCPHPDLGIFLRRHWNRASAQLARDEHEWTHHILPQRAEQAAEQVSAILAELAPGCRFVWRHVGA